jgi:hypothetical protein
MDRAQQRLMWAVVASALLHVGFVRMAQQPGAPRVAVAGGVPITATLALPPEATTPQTLPRNAPALENAVTDRAVSKRNTGTAVAPITAERLVEQPLAAQSAGVAAPTQLTQPSDPTYYAARDLDVFPKAITALNLGLGGAPGKVRATVLIDESGTVNEVRAIDASATEIENAARDLLLRARFTPASKDGRVVKAQVLVSLDYGLP